MATETPLEIRLLHLLVERLHGHAVHVVAVDKDGHFVSDREAEAVVNDDYNGFSVGRGRTIRMSEIINLVRKG